MRKSWSFAWSALKIRMRKSWGFAWSALKKHRLKIAYCVFVLIFWILPYWPKWIPSWLPEASKIEFWGAILLLPAAILSSRLTDEGETIEGAADVFVESIVAVATACLLVGIERPMSESPLKLLGEKIPEISLVTILVFAVQIVSKSTSAVKSLKKQIEEQLHKLQGASVAVTNSSTEIKTLSTELNKAAILMQASGNEVAEARYAAVAARVLGLKHQDRLYLRGQDGEPISDRLLAPVTERALDSIQAWIQTGLHIDGARKAGAQGRRTWWRLMEAYHREEVFDVSQMEVATNVRSFAMMLLVVISEYLSRPPDRGRLVIVNVSKFPPKDFYNFPNGKPGNRFYHEPEFFGTYRRALAVLARDPDVSAKRIILCHQRADANSSSPAIGANTVEKIAHDCAVWHFLPTPLTFANGTIGEPSLPESLEYLYSKQNAVRAKLPHGVRRVLITPHSTWIPEGDISDSLYYQNLLSKTGFSQAAMRAQFLRFQQDAKDILAQGLVAIAAGANGSDAAGITEQLDLAWTELLKGALGFYRPLDANEDSAMALLKSIESVQHSLGRQATADQEPQPASQCAGDLEFYREQYGEYLRSIISANEEFLACITAAKSALVGEPGTEQYAVSEQAKAKTLAGRVISLLQRSQVIDSIDKYLQLVLGNARRSAPPVASTGLTLGLAENWVHRALVYIEASMISDQVKKIGALPLWLLLATDLCGMGEAGKDFEKFIGNLPDHIRLCDSHLKEDLLDEFLLVGVAGPPVEGEEPTGGDPKTGLSNIQWKALVGTNISEPFHTCRIQFDFGNYRFAPSRGGATRPDSDSKSAEKRSPLELHADWAVDVWNDSEATGKFVHALRAKWQERELDKTS